MGTTASANAEWIELYNTGTESVVLDDWTLTAVDGSPSISLTGVISAQGYFLLERTSDETIPQVSANQIYSGSLGNNGEHLVLKNKEANIINEVDQVSGWLAGDNTTKQSMQLVGNSWITGEGTPGAQNNGVVIEDSETTPVGSATATATSSNTTTQNIKKDSDEEIIPVNPDPRYSAKVISPNFSTAGVPVPFSVQVKQGTKKDLVSGRFEWYLGGILVWGTTIVIAVLFWFTDRVLNFSSSETFNFLTRKETLLPLGACVGGKVQDIIKAGKSGGFEEKKDGSIVILGERLSQDEVKIAFVGAEGQNIASDHGIVVSLDTTVTDELKEEGFVRELIRAVQNIRKDAGLSFTDSIALQVKGCDDALKKFGKEIEEETRSVLEKNDGSVHEVEIDGRKIVLHLKKNEE
jgi:hypothetical protein